MLSEGLKEVNNASVVIGIAEGEKPKNLDVLLRVSEDGFSTSARVFLLEYCKVKFGRSETGDYLKRHAGDPRLAWAIKFFGLKKKWASEPDDAARVLINAICDGSEEDIRNAVDAGGSIMTSDMLLCTLPFSELSDEILEYIFANAMTLPVRCLAVMAISEEIPNYNNTAIYDRFCNMQTVLINLLINDEGVVGLSDGPEHLWGLSGEELREKYGVELKSLSCPRCRQEIVMPVFDAVNITKTPELKEKILNREVFTLLCPHCGYKTVVPYPMLYRDDDSGLLAQVCQSRQAAIDYRFPLDIPACKALAENHYLRAVVGVNGLIERIRLFESNMNELAVAYLKKRIATEKEDVESVFFENADDETIRFTVIYRNGTLDSAEFPDQAYQLAIGFVDACGCKDKLTNYLVDTNVFD